MSLTYDVIDVSLRRNINDKVSSAKRERLILLPVKFQLYIISRSTNLQRVNKPPINPLPRINPSPIKVL